MTISSFKGQYRFLSNFYPAKVWLSQVAYPSVEHAYQAAKTLNPTERALIQHIASAAEAKRLGQRVQTRYGWDEVKLDYMTDFIWQKFTLHIQLREKLIATLPEPLEEGNTWGDMFWGTCNGVGENHLGKILMLVRQEIQDGHERPLPEPA